MDRKYSKEQEDEMFEALKKRYPKLTFVREANPPNVGGEFRYHITAYAYPISEYGTVGGYFLRAGDVEWFDFSGCSGDFLAEKCENLENEGFFAEYEKTLRSKGIKTE